jgi:N-acetylglucosamine kinase-like BadF-type ATPase
MAGMTHCIIALDIGGTKARLVVETLDGKRVLDTELPSQDWDAEPVDRGAAWLDAKLKANVPAGLQITSLAFGAQGINSPAIAHDLTAELARLGYPATVVNDAALIVPAAGFDRGIGIIAGTGAIGVGMDAAGAHMAAGGWGSVIGDEGGAAALVREATRAALRALDEGRPDDGLLSALIADFGVADAERLTRKVNDEPTAENWAPHCPAVFAAADAGSALAQRVIVEGARYLAALVGQLLARGATGTDIVVAGSVIVNQAQLHDAFVAAVRAAHPHLKVHKLTLGPVEGAVFLARRTLVEAA